jgi:hypothetical protein
MRVSPKRLLRGILKATARPHRLLVLWITLLVWPRRSVDGFEVLDLTPHLKETPDYGRPLGEALCLIKRVDLRRFRRMQRDLRRFIIARTEGAEYVHPARACLLDAAYLTTVPAARLALTIVHEATHARLWNAGFHYRQSARMRIEEICVREEVSFACRLPGGDELAERARIKLEDPWWTEQREFERRVSQLKALGKSKWYLRLYQFLNRP